MCLDVCGFSSRYFCWPLELSLVLVGGSKPSHYRRASTCFHGLYIYRPGVVTAAYCTIHQTVLRHELAALPNLKTMQSDPDSEAFQNTCRIDL